MPEGGTLSVRARAGTIADLGWDAKDGYRCIEFVDSGRALPDEQLLREIRARRPRAKIIMISGYGENILQGILDQYEGVVFLPKPFTLDELIARVDDVMG